MNKAQLSISIIRTSALTAHAARMNHGADSPMIDRAMPAVKKAAMPSSATIRAVALVMDIKDSSAVVDKTTLTWRRGLEDEAGKLIGSKDSPLLKFSKPRIDLMSRLVPDRIHQH
jgi:hypothetical protein